MPTKDEESLLLPTSVNDASSSRGATCSSILSGSLSCRKYSRCILFSLMLWLLLVMMSFYGFSVWHVTHYAVNLSRPLWDSGLKNEYGRWNIINYMGIGSQQGVCQLHSFPEREFPSLLPRVYDAFLFNSELDMLEIRLNELDPVVDVFIISESTCTFMGQSKPLNFDLNKNRTAFSKFLHKIRHHKRIVSDCSHASVSFQSEREAREELIHLARKEGAENGDIFHMSDLDEIPRRQVLTLLQKCDFGDRIHLALDSYLYSFEFRVWPQFVFRSTVSVIGRLSDDQITWRFGRYLTDKLLGDAGWHCSWCMRSLDEMISKMKGYSHSDRLKHDPSLLDKSKLKEKVCQGKDPFDYLPEAINYQELISTWYVPPRRGISHVPEYVAQNPEKFRYLLPGGCDLRS